MTSLAAPATTPIAERFSNPGTTERRGGDARGSLIPAQVVAEQSARARTGLRELAFALRLTPRKERDAAALSRPVAPQPEPKIRSEMKPPSIGSWPGQGGLGIARVTPIVARESGVAAAETARPAAAQKIVVQIPRTDGPPVNLQVMERAGQVHVTVHTADGALQSWLRQDLGTLVNSLEQTGYRTEALA